MSTLLYNDKFNSAQFETEMQNIIPSFRVASCFGDNSLLNGQLVLVPAYSFSVILYYILTLHNLVTSLRQTVGAGRAVSVLREY